jgi:hypothetical protein
VLDLADARTDDARRDAVREAAEVLAAPQAPASHRVAAALVLGRLRRVEPEVIAALGRGLAPKSPGSVRSTSAWALGELRSPESLPPLIQALRQRPGLELGRHLLQALAKHHAVLATRPDLVIEAVSAMTHFSGNLVDDEVPPAYALLSARTRTLEVDIQVLASAIDTHRQRPTRSTAAALYAAAFEILARLDASRQQLAAAGARTRARESIRAAAEAARASDTETFRLVAWFLGQLATEPLYAPAAAQAVLELEDRARRASDRLIVAWALARAQLHDLAARRALSSMLFADESSARLLRALGASAGASAEDILQRVVGVKVRGP